MADESTRTRTPNIVTLNTKIDTLDAQIAKLEAKRDERAKLVEQRDALLVPENKAAMQDSIARKRAELEALLALEAEIADPVDEDSDEEDSDIE
jgi:hypothetical protein